MLICPTCRKTLPVTAGPVCPADGHGLVDAEAFYQAYGDPLIGTVIAHRYEVIARIGVGGMGTVYRARQKPLNREVALKILKREVAADAETVQRFHREARASSVLVHPNTVRVYDFGETSDGLLYIAMELLEGESLSSRLARPSATTVSQSVGFAVQILGSLAEAATKGIVHRDLKPDNIFLSRVQGHAEPVIKVLDFGVAKIISGDRAMDVLETQAGTVFGTPRYMSPEQAQGKKLDARSDLYSVGVLLFQMLTGRPPFTDDDAVIVMAKHIREAPPRPTVLVPDRPIPDRLEKIVLRALGKQPAQRFPNAEQFIAALDSVRAEVKQWEAARDQGQPLPRPKRAPVGLLVGAAAASLAVVAAVVLGVALLASRTESQPRISDRAPAATHAAPSLPTGAREPALRQVRIESEPAGATVMRDGVELGRTPFTVALGHAATRLELRASGYVTKEARLGPDTAETVRIHLEHETALVVSDPTSAVPQHGRRDRPPRAAPATGESGGGHAATPPSHGPYAPLDR